jgi:hypothetical protein
MFGLRIPSGLIYHITSAKRIEVVFDHELRALTCAPSASRRPPPCHRITVSTSRVTTPDSAPNPSMAQTLQNVLCLLTPSLCLRREGLAW